MLGESFGQPTYLVMGFLTSWTTLDWGGCVAYLSYAVVSSPMVVVSLTAPTGYLPLVLAIGTICGHWVSNSLSLSEYQTVLVGE
jgi:hypothetical protein